MWDTLPLHSLAIRALARYLALNRQCNPKVTLRYRITWWGGEDLNLRPFGKITPKCDPAKRSTPELPPHWSDNKDSHLFLVTLLSDIFQTFVTPCRHYIQLYRTKFRLSSPFFNFFKENFASLIICKSVYMQSFKQICT